jgi:hypothetical protein
MHQQEQGLKPSKSDIPLQNEKNWQTQLFSDLLYL